MHESGSPIRLACVVLTAMLVFVLAGKATAMSLEVQRSRSEERLSAAAECMAARAGVRLSLLPAAANGRVPEVAVYVDETTGDEFLVDSRRGPVSYCSRSAAEQLCTKCSSSACLPPETLLEMAREYAAERNPGVQVSEMEESIAITPVGLGENGCAVVSECRAEFVEYRTGIPTSNRIVMTMNPYTGQLVSMIRDIASIDVDTTPTISSAEAIRRVQEEFDMPLCSSQSSTLAVWRDPADLVPHLTWLVEVRTGPKDGFGATAFGYVDAHSGGLLNGAVSE